MLGGANHRAVDKVHVPVQAACLLRLALQSLQDTLPEARGPPAIEAAGDGAPGTKAGRQIAPRSTRTNEPPNAVDDATVTMVGATRPGTLRGKQRFELFP